MGANRFTRRSAYRRHGAVAMGAAIAASMVVPLVFTAVDALPAEAAGTSSYGPTPSPTYTCGISSCGTYYEMPTENDTAVTTPNTATDINVLANDCTSSLSGQSYTFDLAWTEYGLVYNSLSGTDGTVTVNSSNQLVFTPALGFTGTAQFYYTWTDAEREINPSTGTVVTKTGRAEGIPALDYSTQVTVSVSSVQQQGTLLAFDAHGGNDPAEPCQCADVPSAQSVGDPVNTATGDLSQSSTDLSLPGAGIPLAFTRTYDAQGAQAEVTASAAAPPLGYGWADNLGMNVAYNTTTQIATVTEETGAQLTFAPYVSGTSPAWCTGVTNFCATAPRVEATLNQAGGGSWTYVRNNGDQLTFAFSSSGALLTITDAQGDTVSASTYSPTGGQTSCPTSNTCQAWTSSASGRELVLATNSSGQLTSVFDANSTLSATFAYSGSGCSTWTGGETAELCTAVDPGGLTDSFTYDSANSNSNLVYDMLTDTPPAASASTVNVYNSVGQITQQTSPTGGVTTFAYTGTNSSVGGGTTTITNYPSGTGSGEPQDVTVDTYSSNVLISETTGAGTSSADTEVVLRDPVSLEPLSVQDGDGNDSSISYQTYSGAGGTETSSGNPLTVTDAVGNTTAYAYNSYNQAWCTVGPADYANGVVCPTSPPTLPPSPGTSDPNAGMTIDFYNSSDQLTATTDTLGNTTTYFYTSGVSGVPNGLMYCSVDPVSYQTSVTCPAYGATHVTGTSTSTFDAYGDVLPRLTPMVIQRRMSTV